MGNSLKALVLGSVLLVPALAAAEGRAPIVEAARAPTFIVEAPRADGVLFARQIVESPRAQPISEANANGALALSRYIYLNKNGAVLSPGGANNSANNISTIVPDQRNFPAWNVSPADWATIKAALVEIYAPFGVTVSDQPPPAGTRFIEAMFGGTAGDAIPANQVPPPSQGYILGVSPFTPDCGIIEDSIVFTFAVDAAMLGETPRQIAEIAAQETAHSFGLDHVLDASDPMTYLPYNGNRTFKSGAVSCGESTARACGLVNQGYPSCRATQDSVALLTERIGTGGIPGDTTPPSVGITAPLNAALVPPGFAVYATASDNVAVTSVDFYIDDVLIESGSSSPYTFHAPATIALGDHVVKVVADDGSQQTTQTINVTVDDNADPVIPPGGGNPGDDRPDSLNGGCSAGGHGGAGLILGLALVGLIRRRR